MPVASSIRDVTAGRGAELHQRVDQLGVRLDDRPGVVLLARLDLRRMRRGEADRQDDVLAEPQRGEAGLVGGGRQVEELGGVDVVCGETDLHE